MKCARVASVLFLSLAFGNAGWSQQPPSDDTATQLRELTAELKATRAEMQQYRSEMQDLQKEVEQLRTELHASASPAAAPASAGPSEPAGGSTIEDRVSTLEDQQQLLQQEVTDQAQTRVESGSKYHLKLTGTLLLNVSGNAGQVNDVDVPNLAIPREPLDAPGNFSATVRQSELGLQMTGPEIWGARSSADLYFDFFGGFPSTLDGTTMGLVRMKIARARLDWANTSLIFGQDAPFISTLSPSSLASLGTPSMGYSGNLWTWVPQVRVEHRWAIGDRWKYTLEGGFMDPLSGAYPEYQFSKQPEPGEKSRVPAFGARNSFSREIWGRRLSIGVGGYYTRQNYGFGRNVDGWAATGDWTLPLTKWLEWSGEAYRGRALGGLWGGVGTSIVRSGALTDPTTQVAGLNDIGGWTQLKFIASPRLEFNAAYGEDNPFASDLRMFGTPGPYEIARNQTTMVNFIQHLRSNLLFSLEYRHLNTSWASAPRQTADHVDAAFGVTF